MSWAEPSSRCTSSSSETRDDGGAILGPPLRSKVCAADLGALVVLVLDNSQDPLADGASPPSVAEGLIETQFEAALCSHPAHDRIRSLAAAGASLLIRPAGGGVYEVRVEGAGEEYAVIFDIDSATRDGTTKGTVVDQS